ncbi:guanylate kinase [Phycisphaera mikurensis]|uniref:Guanylate kinase n=1 Tax=Phycisphaera mikurensis (strain NBRC 102666 / KCTC 22515 / FYK2301M01) TaxID=1142394 RepID=I0IHR7_PHYMF|nr:guanylate kinase [Phycisphaera mikurensis]MBB6441049.1 guanylate kinase [Phycisphaera mikurensis]BAM04805.1 guanylate kinase [Phycisphaera mikurensis NBRC 102666]
MSDQSERNPGFLVIVSGPSGVGKSTLVNRLLPRIGAELSISKTTRSLRPGDVDGQHYHFVSVESFQDSVAEDDFLEHAAVHGNHYGTPRRFVTEHLAAGRCVVLEIDVNGAAQVKQLMPEAFGIFILAPDEQTLLDRLRSRAQDDEDVIRRRFNQAKEEIHAAQTSNVYAGFVTNDDLDRALEELVGLVEAERARRVAERSQAAGAGS